MRAISRSVDLGHLCPKGSLIPISRKMRFMELIFPFAARKFIPETRKDAPGQCLESTRAL